MNVPRHPVEHRVEHIHRHEPRPRFHQPPRPQTALPEFVHPICRAHTFRFTPQIRRVRAHHHRIERAPQRSAALAMPPVTARAPDRPRQQHMRRHPVLRSQGLRRHRPHMRIFHAVFTRPPGLHNPMTRIVNRRARVIAAADQRIPVGQSRHARKVFRNANARHVRLNRRKRTAYPGRRLRLRIPRIELRRPAHQKQQNAALARIRRPRAQPACPGQRRHARAQQLPPIQSIEISHVRILLDFTVS